MLDVRNRTPFEVTIIPGMDKEGSDFCTVVLKGTFDLPREGDEPRLAAKQLAICDSDRFVGKPGESSIVQEGDRCPAKPGTDVVLVGHAVSPKEVLEHDVVVRAGTLAQTIRVIGDRTWYKAVGRWQMTDPQGFTSMPLVYERAFGGQDTSSDDSGEHGWEPRNPIGTGFALRVDSSHIDGMRLPNLEDPAQLIAEPTDCPSPAGVGFIGRHWEPRVRYSGTYDETWRRRRCPLLPNDFDDRYFNGAHPRLVSERHFVGGEKVAIDGVRRAGQLTFTVPQRALDVLVRSRGRLAQHLPALDTLVIDSDQRRLVVLWRVNVPCARSLLYIDHLRIREREAA